MNCSENEQLSTWHHAQTTFNMARFVVIVGVLSVLSGCLFYPSGKKHMGNGVRLLNLATNDSFLLQSGGGPPPSLVSVPEDNNHVYTIQGQFKHGEKDHIQLSKYDLSRGLVESYKIPYYSRYYGQGMDNKLIVSPDRNEVVYLKKDKKSLYIYQLDTGREKLLWDNIQFNIESIKGMFWADNKTVVLLFGRDSSGESHGGELVTIDVSSSKVNKVMQFEDLGSFSFSPASKLLAVTSPSFSPHRILIFDVTRMRVVDEIEEERSRQWIYKLQWNQNGTMLVYAHEGSQQHALTLYDIEKKKTKILKELPRGGLTYFISISNDSTCLILYSDKAGESNNELLMLDLASRQEVRQRLPGLWGDIEVYDNGKIVAYVTR